MRREDDAGDAVHRRGGEEEEEGEEEEGEGEEEEKDEDASVKFAWAVGAFLEAGRAYRTANWYRTPTIQRYRTPYVPKVK